MKLQKDAKGIGAALGSTLFRGAVTGQDMEGGDCDCQHRQSGEYRTLVWGVIMDFELQV